MRIFVGHEEVIVDDDCELFSPHSGMHYYVNKIGGKFYVFRQEIYTDEHGVKRTKRVYLHTDITHASSSESVRHLDGNPLNNRLSNLYVRRNKGRDE